jgi:hypothetical protein
MTVPKTGNDLVATFLGELRQEAKALPQGTRQELVEEIARHLRAALPVGATQAATRTELERLGEPGQIVAEARKRLGFSSRTAGRLEWIAVALLLAGGFLLGVGWFIGVAMLWSSRAWTKRDKWVGTLVVPGDLVPAFLVSGIRRRGQPRRVVALVSFQSSLGGAPVTRTYVVDDKLGRRRGG